MSRAARFVQDIADHGWEAKPWIEAAAIAKEDPLSILEIVRLCIEKIPGRSMTTLTADLLYRLPAAAWPEIVDYSMRIYLSDNKNEIAETVFCSAIYQFPKLLNPYLNSIFRIDTLFQSSHATHAWREADEQSKHFLFQELILPNHANVSKFRYGIQSNDTRIRAFSALLETRNIESMIFASKLRESLPSIDNDYVWWLENVGFEFEKGIFRKIYPEDPLHIIFPDGYLMPLPEHFLSDKHPTWSGGVTTLDGLRFGGWGSGQCSICQQQNHHIISLDPIPANLGIQGITRIQIDSCLSCLGWSVDMLWFQHDDRGQPIPLAVNQPMIPDFPSAALAETRVSLAQLQSRWRWQDWGASNGRVNLNRIGGYPSWIQNAHHPLCIYCRQRTTFLFQLDSELSTMDGGYLLWGSGGLLYVFWCGACRLTVQFWQCT